MYQVLLVEDEIYSLRGMQVGIDFSQAGFEAISTADNIRKAKVILQEQEIAVMLCDIEMPGGNGIELLAWMQEHSPRTVTVFLSCHADFSYAQQSIRLGAFDYILKPAPYPELTKVLAAALEKYRTQERNRSLTEAVYSTEDSMRETGDTELVRKIKEYVVQNLANELSREQIGACLYLNPDYVARVFRKSTGISLSRYILNKRLQVAQELLRETEASIGEICVRIGYQNHSHFTKLFKKETGMTPQEYRQMN